MQHHAAARTGPPGSPRPSASLIAASLLRSRPAARSDHMSLSITPDRDPGGGRLLTTVPKRLLSRAVDRNQFKRVVRECWRAAPGALRERSALIRLARCPKAYSEWSASERRRRWREEVSGLILLTGAGLSVPRPPRKRHD